MVSAEKTGPKWSVAETNVTFKTNVKQTIQVATKNGGGDLRGHCSRLAYPALLCNHAHLGVKETTPTTCSVSQNAPPPPLHSTTTHKICKNYSVSLCICS
jgi:hypothetical protein